MYILYTKYIIHYTIYIIHKTFYLRIERKKEKKERERDGGKEAEKLQRKTGMDEETL